MAKVPFFSAQDVKESFFSVYIKFQVFHVRSKMIREQNLGKDDSGVSGWEYKNETASGRFDCRSTQD